MVHMLAQIFEGQGGPLIAPELEFVLLFVWRVNVDHSLTL